jgi:toxin ParE1/3/4
MAATLIWTDAALGDLEGIAAFIAQDSPHFAASTIDAITGAVEKVTEFPQLGRVVPEFGDPRLREVIWRDYRIVYPVGEGQVAVTAVVHGSHPLTGKARQSAS